MNEWTEHKFSSFISLHVGELMFMWFPENINCSVRCQNWLMGNVNDSVPVYSEFLNSNWIEIWWKKCCHHYFDCFCLCSFSCAWHWCQRNECISEWHSGIFSCAHRNDEWHRFFYLKNASENEGASTSTFWVDCYYTYADLNRQHIRRWFIFCFIDVRNSNSTRAIR